MPESKVDDTNTIPETITAPWLKRFFKHKLGVPVRVHNAGSTGWVQVWIMSDRAFSQEESADYRVKYSHQFTEEFGNRCMRIIYSGSKKPASRPRSLSEQSWGGNISRHSIALKGGELRELLQGILDKPLGAEHA